MSDEYREIDGKPLRWAADGVVHACVAVDAHPGVRLVWTECEIDVPANEARLGAAGEVTCPRCFEQWRCVA